MKKIETIYGRLQREHSPLIKAEYEKRLSQWIEMQLLWLKRKK